MDDKFNIMSKEHKMLDLKFIETQKDVKAILQNMRDSKDQKHEKTSSDTSVTSSHNSESPIHRPKGTQYQSFIMYPPRPKIEMTKYNGGE